MPATKRAPIEYLGFVIGGGFALFMLVGLYQIFIVGSPENKKFRDDCFRRNTREYMPGYVPDPVIDQVVAQCERELRQHIHENSN
jgi:hypothetical protein